MDHRRRVLLITDWMSAPGGAELYARRLRDGLRAAGDDVCLLTSSAGSAADGTADIVALGPRGRAAQSVLQIVNPWAVAAVRRARRDFRPDVAIVHLFAYHLSPAIFRALAGLPIVLMVLDYKIVCPLGSKLLPDGALCEHRAGLPCWRSGCLSSPHWLREQVRYASIGAAVRAATLVLACSRHVQRVLAADGIRSEVLGMPTADPPDPVRRAPADHPLFVFSGRLSREKGVLELIRAFRRLHHARPDARLRIVGEGPLRPDAERLAAALGLGSAVTLTGWLDSGGVQAELTGAWALVAPSTWAEPFGQVAPEAIVSGVPVVASRLGGFSDTVEDEVSGLLFDNGDEGGLYRCLARIADGTAFPSHAIDPTVVRRAVEAFGVARHVDALRGWLDEAGRRQRAAASNQNPTSTPA